MKKGAIGCSLVLLFSLMACFNKEKNYPKLEMTADEIVYALVQMYTVNAAINLNDAGLKDSTSSVYYNQVAKLTGKPVEVIKSDFEKLQTMQDSLIILQTRALDTIRTIREKQMTKSGVINSNIN